jgi:hypothetical protein
LWDVQVWAWGPKQAEPERPQAPLALLPLEKLVRLQVLRVPLYGQLARPMLARHWVLLELFLERRWRSQDGLRADALLADGAQAHGLQERVPLGRP